MNLLIKMGKQIAKHKFLILLIGFLLLIPSLNRNGNDKS